MMFKFTKTYGTILIIPDLHIPAHHRDAFKFLKKVKDTCHPDLIVNVGDLGDFHSISYHEHDPDLPNPGKELSLVRDYVGNLSHIFPEMVCLFGNHDKLIQRKLLTLGLPTEAMRNFSDIINAPEDWQWVNDFKCKTPRGEVYFVHGKTQVPNKLAQMMGISCVQGHYHTKFYISYYATPTGLYWDMNVGSLVDKDHPAMAYGTYNLGKPVLGCAVIKDGKPMLVPMQMKPGGRWIGRI